MYGKKGAFAVQKRAFAVQKIGGTDRKNVRQKGAKNRLFLRVGCKK